MATNRLALPLLAAGQAQKEVVHNEALAAIDLLIGAAAETIGDDAPPPAPAIGQSWIVGAAPTGDWAGHAHALAGWTEGGWRFVAPYPGMRVWIEGVGGGVRYGPMGWSAGAAEGTALVIGGEQVVGPRRPAIAPPTGGATIDVEARAVLATVLSMLQSHGMIAA